MRFTPRTWMLVSLLLFAGAAFFWLKGNERLREQQLERAGAPKKDEIKGTNGTKVANARPHSLLSTSSVQALIDQQRGAGAPRRGNVSPAGFGNSDLRLSNTGRSLDELVHDDRAILLRNALIDTRAGVSQIPPNLQNQGEASSFIVQSKSAPDARFRAELAAAGASIVSYVPNNAYLVQANAGAAKQLQESELVSAVLPYEPYYKLNQRLLATAVAQNDLPAGAMLRVTFFPGQRENGIQAVQQLGASVVGEEPSPFGPQVLIEPPRDVLPALARLGVVQGIEPAYVRKPANDLTRVQIGLSEDTVTNANYLDLTGTNVWVNINDTGIDSKNADLKGRVFSPFVNVLTDTNGHGTFVAAILAGNGTNSTSLTDTNGYISATNANYRGIASEAKLFELPLDFLPEVNLFQNDTYLQETAASTNYLTLKRTNSLISNNSWVYDGSLDYDSAAARYDAAVRDALPGVTGSQGVAYVFPAGNNGFGEDDGTGGEPGLISSPGTAKNVITVGALEHARFITNFVTNIVATMDEKGSNIFVTNQIAPFLTASDSSNEVASYSSRGNVGIGIEGTFGRVKPDVVAPGSFIISARSTNWTANFDTNTPEGQISQTISTNLGAYRIDSGTTYAVPVVSGMMALFQEFFETKAKEHRVNLSPALMKALVINGARSANSLYDVSPLTTINYQGWGLVNLQRSLPALLEQTNALHGPMQLIDQSPTNALGTGQSRTWTLSLNTNGLGVPLRATLVWTDPPGNPNVGVKLVNDLDLVITNLESGYVFYGNDIQSGTDFNTPTPPDVEGVPDAVNNVENVFIQNPAAYGTNFTVTVRARRVNVNAVPDYLATGGSGNDIVQDFALVISSDNGIGTNLFTSFAQTNTVDVVVSEPPTTITNGLPLLSQRVGANPLQLGTNGLAAQWRFYTFTNFTVTNEFNSLTNGSNVAFVTFAPPNLAVSRTLEADIDLYVSLDRGLLSLTPNAVANAMKSTQEGGTEFIIMTNSPVGPNVIYYVAVKSEDQQAAEFSLMGVSSDEPFQQERNGNIILQGYPLRQVIPDGAPNLPGGTVVLALGIDPRRIAAIQVAEEISHEDLGDLLGNLSHNHSFAVLNNHTLDVANFSGTNWLVYNDNLSTPTFAVSNGIPARLGPADGPGTLNSFVGTSLIGPWFLTMVDNAPTHTGRVENLQITLRPLRDLKGGVAVGSVDPGESVSYPVDVPAGATNLIVTLTQTNTSAAPLELFLGLTGVPDPTNAATYQVAVTNFAGASQLEYNVTNSPPLQPGSTYYLTIFNPSQTDTTGYELQVRFAIDFNADNHSENLTTNAVKILNDARTNTVFSVEDDRLVADVSVGVRIDYPRVSDLLLTLTSPQGTRVVLAENRGGASASAFGMTYGTNQLGYVEFTEDTNIALLPIKFAIPPFFDIGATNGVIFSNSFDNVTANTYTPGQSFGGGWTVLSNEVQVVAGTNAHTTPNYLSLENGTVQTNVATVIGREYELQFVYGIFSASFAPNLLVNNTPTDAAQMLQEEAASQRLYNWLVTNGATFSTNASGDVMAVEPNGMTFNLGFPLDSVPTNSGTLILRDWQGSTADAQIAFLSSGASVEIGTNFVHAFDAGSGSSWATNRLRFTATATNTPIRFNGLSGSMEIDTVTLKETGSVSYLPEESLDLFKSERAYGDWRLDVYDTRSNQFVNGSVISWYLNLDYANPTTSAVVLNSGGANQYLGAIQTNQVNYFVVEPCDNTTDITIVLTGATPGSNLLLSADRNGFPTGNPLTDDYIPLLNDQAGYTAVLHLTTNSPAPAPLIQGQPLFLTVQNLDTSTTNTFRITARFSPSPKCVPVTNIRIKPSSSFTSAFAAVNEGDPDSFVLQPSSNATTLTLDLTSPANADLGILVKRGGVPTPQDYDYKQDLSGAAPESITLDGLNLSSDPWYAVVYNNSAFPTAYTLNESEASAFEFVNVAVDGSGINLTFTSIVGGSYVLQASSDLVHWNDLTTIVASANTTTVIDANPTAQAKFYRVVKNSP